jgi:hypothetical protein
MARGQVDIGELVKLIKGVPTRGQMKPVHRYIEKSRPPTKATTKKSESRES